MNMLALAQPPIDMTTPQGAYDTVQVIMWVLVGLAVVASIYFWRRDGVPTALLLMAGGLVCSLNEALADILGKVWFPTDQWAGYTLLDRAVPMWVVLAYVLFFGFFVYVIAEIFDRKPSHRAMWLGIVAFWVANSLLEMPILASDVYQYYGRQPLELGGFPLTWLTINVLGVLGAAVVVVRFRPWFTGVRQLFLLPLVFMTYMASWTLAMPHFWAVNSDLSTAWMTVASLVSVSLQIVAIDVLIKVGLQGPIVVPSAAAEAREPVMSA